MNEAEKGLDVLTLPQQRYVEVIGELARARGDARMTDVAGRLAVSVPSASEAVKRLVEMGLAARNARRGVELTAAGKRAAEQLERRHDALKRFMIEVMAMEPDRADEVACRVEHCVDRQFADRLVDLAQFLERDYPWTLAGIAEHVRGAQAKRLGFTEAQSGI